MIVFQPLTVSDDKVTAGEVTDKRIASFYSGKFCVAPKLEVLTTPKNKSQYGG